MNVVKEKQSSAIMAIIWSLCFKKLGMILQKNRNLYCSQKGEERLLTQRGGTCSVQVQKP